MKLENEYLYKKIGLSLNRKLTFMLVFCMSLCGMSFAQYVHPNQPGRKGGDTGVGVGNQVVTSTYFGTAGNPVAQGVIMSVNKDGTNKSSFHDFDGFPSDGSYPFYTTPFQASDGNLYGTSFVGGANNLGAIYKFDFQNSCDESLIYSNQFGSGSNGNFANINELSDGRIYYPATYGGTLGQGALYSMNKDGSDVQLVHQFNAASTVPHTASAKVLLTLDGAWPEYDGIWPYGFVVEGPDGKIYGTCFAGGGHNRGVVYRMDKNGSNYEIINSMGAYGAYKDGSNSSINAWGIYNPWGNVAIDQSGKVYVTGYYGGTLNFGGVARMNPDGSDYQILVSGSAQNGTYPYRGALIIDDKVYGTFRTNGGGTAIGVVYRMNLDGSNYTKIKTFDSPYNEGTDPWSGLVYDGEFLYGTTLTNGGPGSVGTIFKIKPDGTAFKSIHSFKNSQSSNCGTKPGLYSYFPSAERVTFADVQVSCSLTCVENSVCNSGSTAPILTATSKSNTCPSSSVDLTDLVSSTCPSGSTLKWFTSSNPTSINEVINDKSVISGTYYPACKDLTNGCYSPTPTTGVTISITNCSNSGNTLSTCNGAVAFVQGQDADKNARIWFSKGDGTFETASYVTTATNFPRYNQIGTNVFGRDNNASTMWADVDNDGDIDIIHATENNNNSIYVYLNAGNNNFSVNPIITSGIQSDGSLEVFAGTTAGEQSWIKDMNSDGNLDYVFSNNSDKVSVWFGNGAGSFSKILNKQSTLSNTSGYHTSGLSSTELFSLDDVTGDNVPDLIGTYDESGSSRISVWKGNGDGTVNPNVYYTRLIEDSGTSNSSGADNNEYSQFIDLNGDGFLDYTHAESFDNTPDIWVWLNDGTGKFPTAPLRTSIPNNSSNLPAGGIGAFSNYTAGSQSFFTDVNSDEKPDLVSTSDDEGSKSGFTVYLNLGTGLFNPSPIRTLIPNDFRTGSDNGTETSFLGCGLASYFSNPSNNTKASGTIDCSKTIISPYPLVGTSNQLTIKVSLNVTIIGNIKVLVSGSGMSIANGQTTIEAKKLGIQDFYLTVNYDGATLNSLNINAENFGTCTINLNNNNSKKKAIIDIWSIDCLPIVGPALK